MRRLSLSRQWFVATLPPHTPLRHARMETGCAHPDTRTSAPKSASYRVLPLKLCLTGRCHSIPLSHGLCSSYFGTITAACSCWNGPCEQNHRLPAKRTSILRQCELVPLTASNVPSGLCLSGGHKLQALGQKLSFDLAKNGRILPLLRER